MWIESFIARLTKRALKLDIYMSVANKTERPFNRNGHVMLMSNPEGQSAD